MDTRKLDMIFLMTLENGKEMSRREIEEAAGRYSAKSLWYLQQHTKRYRARNKMIMELVKNEDFENVDEFETCRTENREELKNFLSWRAGGGHFKFETLDAVYIDACKKLLKTM
ncbi:MAG: hypothetical protein OSJ72_19545 [Lachnospiraceae bacterium]|nr:hypothetical protein [Lachnospiraceae bacterium]